MRKRDTEALEALRKWLKPGDTLYTVLRSVARTGMSRTLDVYLIRENEPMRLTWYAAKALGWPYNKKREALSVYACGMDAGFHAVYTLGALLWPNGTPEPHGTRNGKPDHDGGYALKQRWI